MNIEELGASNPGGWASSIIDGLWFTMMLAVAYLLFAKAAIYNLMGWELPLGSDDDGEDNCPHHW